MIPQFEDAVKTEKNINEFRGIILDKVVYIENMINFVLSNYFCKNQSKQTFMEFVLDKEFFTFFQKIRLFEDLKLHKHPKVGDKYKGYFGKLKDIDEIRNAFAHGFVQEEDNKLILWYKKGGKTKNLKVDDVLKEEFLNIINELDCMFVELISIYTKS